MKTCGDDLLPIVGNRTVSSKATDKEGMTGKCLIPFDQDSWDSYNILIKEYGLNIHTIFSSKSVAFNILIKE